MRPAAAIRATSMSPKVAGVTGCRAVLQSPAQPVTPRRLVFPSPWRAGRFLPVLPYLLLLLGAYSVFCVTTDDPFITYRYAANLLAGHGPVFNIGERVEGFSSPLHLLLMACCSRSPRP